MNKKEVVENVLDYINDGEVRYAILINGTWGSGKTYLYDNDLAKEIAKVECGRNERKTNVYISLYGISDIESLAKELFTNYMFRVKHINRKAYKITNGMASIVSKFISVSVGSVSVNFSGIKNFLENKLILKIWLFVLMI